MSLTLFYASREDVAHAYRYRQFVFSLLLAVSRLESASRRTFWPYGIRTSPCFVPWRFERQGTYTSVLAVAVQFLHVYCFRISLVCSGMRTKAFASHVSSSLRLRCAQKKSVGKGKKAKKVKRVMKPRAKSGYAVFSVEARAKIMKNGECEYSVSVIVKSAKLASAQSCRVLKTSRSRSLKRRSLVSNDRRAAPCF